MFISSPELYPEVTPIWHLHMGILQASQIQNVHYWTPGLPPKRLLPESSPFQLTATSSFQVLKFKFQGHFRCISFSHANARIRKWLSFPWDADSCHHPHWPHWGQAPSFFAWFIVNSLLSLGFSLAVLTTQQPANVFSSHLKVRSYDSFLYCRSLKQKKQKTQAGRCGSRL